MVLGTAPAEGQDAALNALFVNVTAAQRVDVTDRNVVVASVAARPASPAAPRLFDASRSPRRRPARSPTFVGLTKPTTARRSAAASPTRTCGPAIVGVFTDLTGPAPPGLSLLGDHRHPVHHAADGAEAGRDAAGDRLDRRRAARAVAAGPARRPADAPADPAALADVHRRRRRRGRRLRCSGTSSAPTPPTTATSCRWPGSPTTPATCRTTSAGSAAPRTRSAGTTTCSP